MKWGSFGPVHLLSLALAAAALVGLYFLLKRASHKTQVWTLGILSFSGIAAIIFNLVTWESPLEYLPLHLCSLNALVLPIVAAYLLAVYFPQIREMSRQKQPV